MRAPNPFEFDSTPVERQGVVAEFRRHQESGDSIWFGETLQQWLGSGRNTPGLRLLGALGLAILLGFAFRLADLQISSGSRLRALAEGNRLRIEYLRPVRGQIADRAGHPLATSRPSYRLIAHPIDLPADPSARLAIADELISRGLLPEGVSREQVSAALVRTDPTVLLADDLDQSLALRLMIDRALPDGFTVEIIPRRQYLASSAFSHLLGYVGRLTADEFPEHRDLGYLLDDVLGKSGIELLAEPLLRGRLGQRQVEVDAHGSVVAVIAEQPALAGQDLRLTIDRELQRQLYDELVIAVRRSGARAGSAALADPSSGELLAVVSYPSFDLNAFTAGGAQTLALLAGPDQPLFPRAWAGQYPPGSTFKPYVALAALAEGVISPQEQILSQGGFWVGGSFFPDWKAGGHGLTDLPRALAESVNTYFYAVGGGYGDRIGLGPERILRYAEAFGFGQLTATGLPAEAAGLLPNAAWREQRGRQWHVGDTYHLAIGQGDLLVTPLQLLAAINQIAAAGRRYPLHLTTSAVIPEAATLERPELLDAVRQGLRQAVTQGSARLLATLPVPVAGKTGTAQAGGNARTHAWFTGYAPADQPELSIVVLIENGGEGSSAAVPVAKAIFEKYFSGRR